MEVTGTVVKVNRYRKSYGSTFVRVTVVEASGQNVTLKYLGDGKPTPAKGQRVTITGVPMTGGWSNVGGASVTVHPDVAS